MKYHILRQVGKRARFEHLFLAKNKKTLNFHLEGIKQTYPKYKLWVVTSLDRLTKKINNS